MCIPAAAASLALTAVGTAYSAYSTMQQGKAQEAQYKYQAAVDRNNKIIADRYAADAIKRGQEEEDEQRRKTQQIIGNQRAGFASNGIDLGSDIVLETLGDSAMYGELDALTIRSNAAREAYGYKVQGMNYEASAGMNTTAAKNSRRAGTQGAFVTILTGGASVLKSYSDFKTQGAF